MGIVVQKFGGSSVESTEKLFNICKFITKEYDAGNKVIVIVSAQGKTTDNLIKEAKDIDEKLENKRELDTLLSVGEQITIAKLAICLTKLGYDAISLTGWQIPIKTNDIYGDSDIINEENCDITTLGRGGSDTTAVAIAAAIKTDKCCIYKDVDGVYNLDPKANEKAFKYDRISYDEMLNLSNNGARVLHNKSIELAKKFKVPIHVKSIYNESSKGTYIC